MDRTVKGWFFSMQDYTDSAKQVLQGYKREHIQIISKHQTLLQRGIAISSRKSSSRTSIPPTQAQKQPMRLAYYHLSQNHSHPWSG